jgi:hypothetical protein
MNQTFKYKDSTFFIASKVYSDFGAHLPLIRSFSLGNNFNPIENPQFPNQPIKYHFLFFLIVALIEKLGVNLALSLNFFSAFGFALLLFMIYKFSFLLWKNKKISILSIILFLFNGSLSFTYFFKENIFSSLSNFFQKIIVNQTFNSFGPWDKKLVSAFWNLNIYTNQRHLGLSFGLILFLIYQIFAFIKTKQNNKPKTFKIIIFSSFLLPIIPLLNQATYIIFLVNLFFLIIFNYKIFFHKTNLKVKIVYFTNLIISLIIFLNLEKSGYLPTLKIGFLSQTNNFYLILRYWFFNLGIYLPIWFFSFFYFRKEKLTFQLIFINSFLFLVANIIQLSPDIINNHKLINFFIIILNIIVAKIVVDLFSLKNIKSKFFIIAKNIFLTTALFFLTFSGFLDLFPIFNDYFIKIQDYQKQEITNYIKTNTSQNSIFLTTEQLYSPASVAGRKIFIDYGYYSWSYGYQTNKRQQLIKEIYQETNYKKLCQKINENRIRYFLISPNFTQKSDTGKIFQLKPEFISSDNFVLINLEKNCSSIN